MKRARVIFLLLAAAALVLLMARPALAQSSFDVPSRRPTPVIPSLPLSAEPGSFAMNPVDLMAAASQFVPQGPATQGPPSEPSQTRGLSTVMNIMVLLTVISLAPTIILMTTCFVRIIIVLSLLRQAIGTQSLPPPQVTTGLALFMTLLVMAPTADRIYNEAVVPYRQGQVTDYDQLWDKAKQPIRDFMFDQIEATGNWSSVYTMLNYRGVDTRRPEALTRADVDMVSLIPAYMLSELKTSFLMGFRVYLPFLVIDMVISTMLISMSMMMLPPVLVSLPFKLLLFVLVDGWSLVVGSLLGSFVQSSPAHALLGPVALSFGFA